ncbi:MAG: DUF4397 domain-containing protein, partial [Actinobacteria bacterium]|nr:DUF4397 domain-containing protein [Actinomycetota bacterium]NIU67108.1 DUF4397 domain-containing protein [Actinomycetota bacterium]
ESTVDERSAQIRALHLAPGAPVVDVYVDGAPDPAFDGLEFTRGSRYATLPRGEHSFDIAPEETSIDDAVISVRDVELAGGTSYTAVAYGPNDDLRALLVDDMPITTDGARLRIGHVAAGVGQVDLWVVPDDAEPAPLAEDLDYGTASGIIDLPSGVHVVGLDLDDDAAVDLEFSLPELPDGTAANVFAVTDAFGAPFLLAQLSDGVTTRIDPNDIPTGPTAGNAWVRALHLSPDAPNVDVFVNDDATPSFADIPFTWGTGFAELPGDEYRFRVSATGAPAADAVLDATLPLADGTATTIVAFDRLSDIGALVLEDDFEDVASGTIRIRAIHAAPAVGQVDIYAYGPDGSINRLYDDVD